MSRQKNKKTKKHEPSTPSKRDFSPSYFIGILAVVGIVTAVIFFLSNDAPSEQSAGRRDTLAALPKNIWIQRAYLIEHQFYKVYTPGWEGAYGAIGDAFLYRATHDETILQQYITKFDLKKMINGTWVDDRAWVCLAELYWWEFTGKTNTLWVADAEKRYLDARTEGRLSHHEGYWSWYNYPANWNVGEPIFTNSNMNQLVSVACKLFEATGDRRFLNDALLVWNGDGTIPGIEQTFYRGNGIWEGKEGRAAFGKQLPWESASYLSVLASLYKATNDPKYKTMAVASARYVLDPRNGWVDSVDYYQLSMDGNGAFVNFLLDAYMIAPQELSDVPGKVQKMLEHVWTNHHGHATVTLHREYDNGIRNGWNPNGGESGYGVDEVGTVHAQAEALRAFGIFAYVKTIFMKNLDSPSPQH